MNTMSMNTMSTNTTTTPIRTHARLAPLAVFFFLGVMFTRISFYLSPEFLVLPTGATREASTPTDVSEATGSAIANTEHTPSEEVASKHGHEPSDLSFQPATTTTITTAFDNITQIATSRVFDAIPVTVRNEFNVSKWTQRTSGGLGDGDRVTVARIYRNADSVFEYGLGESTYIADYVGVPRYKGVDSDPVWVTMARDKVSSHFRFGLADIGKTKAWGYPTHPTMAKNIWSYQIAPLQVEPKAFDVYMVDGRWRFGCLIATFLHASARGGKGTIVLVHDCWRKDYHLADHLLDVEKNNGKICVYTRKEDTTDEQLLHLWTNHHTILGR